MGDRFIFDTQCPASGDFIYQLASGARIPENHLQTFGAGPLYAFFDNGQGLIVSGYDTQYTIVDGRGDWSIDNNGLPSYLGTLSSNTSGSKLRLFSQGSNTNSNLTQANELLSSDQRIEDTQLINDRIQKEYCFYKSRYNILLKEFLRQVAPSSGPKPYGTDATGDQQKLLEALIEVNKRMNAFVALVKYIGDNRIASLNTYLNALNDSNNQINASIASLGPTANILGQNDAISHTRKEMVRFTKEKNNAITNQITMWASLNVVAIAIIFHVYRNM